MIMNSGRFGGGGGGSGRTSGGSNRDVVFTARVETKDARKQLADLGKDVDALQKRLGSMRAGVGGGVGGAGGGARSGGLGGPSILLSDSSFDRQQKSFFDKALREENRAIKQAAQERMRDMKSLKKDTKDAMEGLIGLSRAFVLFGVSSEENMEKAVRALAKFEGAVAGYKGGMKLAEGLGGLLGRGAGRLGIAAGAGGTALGAAGIAAGVGVLGGGLAIADQIRYSRGGGIGAYSQGYANMATGLAGTLSGYGIDPRGGGMNSLFAAHPAIGLLHAGGFYGAADSNARYGSSLKNSIGSAGGLVEESHRRLAIEQQILGIMEREAETIRQASAAADQRRNGAAMAFGGLSPWDQRGVTKLRDRFLSNPGSLSNRELQAIQPFVGSSENAQIQSRIRDRMPAGFFSRGFAAESEADFRRAGESGARPNGVNIQRNIVLQLQIDNASAIQKMEGLLDRALEMSDDELKAWAERFEKKMNDRLRQLDQQRQFNTDAQLSGFGGGVGF